LEDVDYGEDVMLAGDLEDKLRSCKSQQLASPNNNQIYNQSFKYSLKGVSSEKKKSSSKSSGFKGSSASKGSSSQKSNLFYVFNSEDRSYTVDNHSASSGGKRTFAVSSPPRLFKHLDLEKFKLEPCSNNQ
jgi:hypothetical protein